MGVAQPRAGYPSKTAAVIGMTAKGYHDDEIALILQISKASVAALRCSNRKSKNLKIINIAFTAEQYTDLSEQARCENWTVADEIKARCFNTDYLDPEGA